MTTILLLAYAFAMGWCLSKRHYGEKWGREVLQRVEAMSRPLYGVDQWESRSPLHTDQECIGRVGRPVVTLQGRSIELHSRSAAGFLRPAAARWRIAPAHRPPRRELKEAAREEIGYRFSGLRLTRRNGSGVSLLRPTLLQAAPEALPGEVPPLLGKPEALDGLEGRLALDDMRPRGEI